jgi:hypothetical protein
MTRERSTDLLVNISADLRKGAAGTCPPGERTALAVVQVMDDKYLPDPEDGDNEAVHEEWMPLDHRVWLIRYTWPDGSAVGPSTTGRCPEPAGPSAC